MVDSLVWCFILSVEFFVGCQNFSGVCWCEYFLCVLDVLLYNGLFLFSLLFLSGDRIMMCVFLYCVRVVICDLLKSCKFFDDIEGEKSMFSVEYMKFMEGFVCCNFGEFEFY